MTSMWGAPVGALTTVLITEFVIPRISGGNPGPIELMTFGGLLIVVMIFAPHGLIDDVGALVHKVPRLVAGRRSPKPRTLQSEVSA
jgi:ABC-type branched-subunit amino acid transport system permease subunit